MKKLFLIMVLLAATIVWNGADDVWAYNFGDYRSVTLVAKAWESLEKGDLDGVLAYTNKCVELYAEQARGMQNNLVDFPKGSDDEIFSYWALNDVATSYFIQGDAYRKEGLLEKAKESYQTVIDNYNYGQCWDLRGWFWKPAEAAQGNLNMIETGIDLDFGDYSSEYLVKKAWEALADEDVDAVVAYVDVCLELYADKAKEMQNSLTEYAWESKEKTFSYWALNDIGTALFVKGEIYRRTGQKDKAKAAFMELIDEYYYSQCWDPKGWFWKPAEAAQQNLDAMGDV